MHIYLLKYLLVHVDVRPLWYRPRCGADAEAEIRL